MSTAKHKSNFQAIREKVYERENTGICKKTGQSDDAG